MSRFSTANRPGRVRYRAATARERACISKHRPLAVAAWDWLDRTAGADTLDGYHLNGYGIQGSVQAALFAANLEMRPDEVHFDSEGDTCNIHFKNLDDAVRAANLACEMINDPAALARMVRIARERGFED